MFALISILAALALFACMLALMELGSRWGRKRLALDPEGARAGTAAAEGAVFALFGLLIAFTFSSAAQRFDRRRDLIVAESNAIGTAWLRLDTLPAGERAPLQQGFRDYLDARLAAYQAIPDLVAAHASLERAAGMQGEIWSRAVAACGEVQPRAMLVLPALNEMFDVASERTSATEMHAPGIVFCLLILLALGCALLAGFAMASSRTRNWTHRIAFAAVVSLTVYTIYDLEYPRRGLVRVESFDHLLVDLRATMK